MSPNQTPTEEINQTADEFADELINRYASSVAENRSAQWKAVVKEELRELIETAADFHKKITEAKTSYKKQFYGKKFQKVSTEIKRMVAVLDRLEQATHENNTEERKEK